MDFKYILIGVAVVVIIILAYFGYNKYGPTFIHNESNWANTKKIFTDIEDSNNLYSISKSNILYYNNSSNLSYPDKNIRIIDNDIIHVFSGGNGILYTVNTKGDLLISIEDGIGTGKWKIKDKFLMTNDKLNWSKYKVVNSGGNGELYGVDKGNLNLYFSKYENESFIWSVLDKQIGNGWDVGGVFIYKNVIYIYIGGRLTRYEQSSPGSGSWPASFPITTSFNKNNSRLYDINVKSKKLYSINNDNKLQITLL
jgi:hypothetical protein